MKSKIVPFVIFIIFFTLGLGLRFLWFSTVQKKILEDKYIYKVIREDKGGGATPQEAWNKYLDALEKGDIEKALLYVWPAEREKVRKGLIEKKKRNEPLNSFKENEKVLYELAPPYYLEKDEKIFTYLSPERQKEYIEGLLKDPFLRKDYEETKKGPVPYTDAFFLPIEVFKFNPYNKKWYIK